MSEWRERSIKDLCLAIVDCVNKTAPSQESPPTPFKMLRTTNVRGGWVDTVNVKYVDEATYANWTRRMVPERGDIILTREAPFGGVGMIRSDDQVFLGQRLVMYRVDESECDPHFLMYSMMGPVVQAELKSLGSGSTVEHLRVPDCEMITIPAPALQDQRKIGAVLRSIDDLVENNRRQAEVLEEMARTIYREWFVKFRYPGHESVPLVDSTLGSIPDGWEPSTVGEVSSVVVRGISPKYAEDGPWIVLNQKCIRDQRVSLAAARKQVRNVTDAKRVRPGDVLINSTGVGTLGRVAIYRGSSQGVTVDSHVTIARPAEQTLSAWFGMSLLAMQAEIERMGSGATGQTELRKSDVESLKLPKPPDDLASEFAATVDPIQSQIDALLAKTVTMSTLRDALLPKLVTGQIDVSKLDLGILLEEATA
jgi:type I restriction enzyme S subunit